MLEMSVARKTHLRTNRTNFKGRQPNGLISMRQCLDQRAEHGYGVAQPLT